VGRDEHRLTRREVERVAVEVEAHDTGPWRRRQHLADGKREHHDELCYPTMALRRARGMLLRLVRRRARAVTIGLMLALPAAWLEFSGRYDAWWVQGTALVLGASGLAILWTGLTGPSPDWVDE
jgi:hypothetical protein